MSRMVAATTLNTCCIGHIVGWGHKVKRGWEDWIQTQGSRPTPGTKRVPWGGCQDREALAGRTWWAACKHRTASCGRPRPSGAELAHLRPACAPGTRALCAACYRGSALAWVHTYYPGRRVKVQMSESTRLRSAWERLLQQCLDYYQEDKRTVKPTWTPHPTATPSYHEKYLLSLEGASEDRSLQVCSKVLVFGQVLVVKSNFPFLILKIKNMFCYTYLYILNKI